MVLQEFKEASNLREFREFFSSIKTVVLGHRLVDAIASPGS